MEYDIPDTELFDDETLELLAKKPKKQKKSAYPKNLFLFPWTLRPFFPGMAAPIFVEAGPLYEALKLVTKTDHKCIGIFLTKDENIAPNEASYTDLYSVGVVARILRITPVEKGAQVIVSIEERVRLKTELPSASALQAKVEYPIDEVPQADEVKAYSMSILSIIKELLTLNPLFKEELQLFLSHSDFTEPGRLADFSVALSTANRNDCQEILEILDVRERIEKALIILNKELDLSRLQKSILQNTEKNISQHQREYYLREQLKAIKKELGLEKEKTSDKEKFEARLADKTVPEQVTTVLQEEMDKLANIEPQSPEYALCRNYIDWLTMIPWGVLNTDIPSLESARKVLDEDHWGLQDVKKRIIEYISILKLSGTLKGTILCLVGPPGVGKTSVGKSIARALNRKFFRFSVGGMQDEAEIKGHRRTYIGAMPGKLIQALKQCQTMNPVIMLDEVDKIGSSYRGDPASALLEVLDPEQNVDFLDQYLDVRCDLSNVLFIVTANTLDSIPEPLLDRMEVIRLAGYIKEEKIEIAQRFLIPKGLKESGLQEKDCTIQKNGLAAIVEEYAREAGVRIFEKCLKKIFRKLAVEKIEQTGGKKTVTITDKNLSKYLGKPVFHSDRYYDKPPVGVATGLAWTSMGGATLFVETIRVPSEKTEMKVTGHAGQVMKESAEIAWSYVQGALSEFAPKHSFFTKSSVHIHFPEGATPKDGPSAGITIVTALFSLLLGKPVAKNLAMTGELTLTGQILPIGGVKEKLVAAKRSGFTTVILPKGNMRDMDESVEEVRQGLTILFADHYRDVFRLTNL